MLKRRWLKSIRTLSVSNYKEDIMYTIEKNVPAPKRKTRTIKYPFADMQVGDSFCAPVSWQALYNTSRYFLKTRKLEGWKFRAAEEEGGARIWRVK